MGRRRFTAVSMTGDIDDLIGLLNIDQLHSHNADIMIGTQQIGTTNLRFQELDALTMELRNALDTFFRSLALQGLIVTTIDLQPADTNLDIATQEDNTQAIRIMSSDGAGWQTTVISTNERSMVLFPDKDGAANADDFNWDPAGGEGFEGFVFDRNADRLYFYANGGVHFINMDG